MKVQKQVGIFLAVLALVILASVPVMAKDSHRLTFDHAVTLNGTQLAPGNYDVSWVSHSPEATVTFEQRKHVAAKAEGRWEDRPNTYSSDSVLYNNNPDGSKSIVEIRFAGMNRALVFGESSPSSQMMSSETLSASTPSLARSPAKRS